jgi:hypothetical protein
LRKAVRWIAETRLDDPQKPLKKVIQEAALKFNLTPLEVEYLWKGADKTND